MVRLVRRVRWSRLCAVALTFTCGWLAVRRVEERAAAGHALEAAKRRAEQAQVRTDALRARLADAEAELAAFRHELARATRPFEAVPAVFVTTPRIDGEVVAAAPGEVELSVGRADGVQPGYHFSVYRGPCFVAKVVVERVLEGSARARVLFAAEGQEVRPGDCAATRLQ